MRYNGNYIKKILEDPFPPLSADERIYLNVPYTARMFAQYSHCGFDPEKKLWFTGCLNANLRALIKLYGMNDATSEKARKLLNEKLQENIENGLG